ncbi:condensation domain-containing protein, partial [Catenulispora pinisilvae]|uniref:condensation domain-containing protein n=1 Tax=Catenulispora pinisilvae TaxID=2705253 RepID=UPI002B26D504
MGLVQVHHLIQDHTTLDVLFAEVQAISAGHEHLLPQPLPFRDFVAQARLGVSPERQDSFFTELLGDVTEPTAPFGVLDVQGDGTDVLESRWELDAEISVGVRQEAQRLGVSAAALLHVAFARVVAATSGREDVVFGTVLFGRMQAGAGADRVPGLFINTLPVRFEVGGVGVGEAAGRMHASLAELLAFEHTPLASAQRVSGVASGSPLFTALFNYRHASGADAQAADVTATGMDGVELLYAHERTNYPLMVAVDDAGTGAGFAVSVQCVAPIDPH